MKLYIYNIHNNIYNNIHRVFVGYSNDFILRGHLYSVCKAINGIKFYHRRY